MLDVPRHARRVHRVVRHVLERGAGGLLHERAPSLGRLAREVVLRVPRDPLPRRWVDGRRNRLRLAAVSADDREQVAVAGVAVDIERVVPAEVPYLAAGACVRQVVLEPRPRIRRHRGQSEAGGHLVLAGVEEHDGRGLGPDARGDGGGHLEPVVAHQVMPEGQEHRGVRRRHHLDGVLPHLERQHAHVVEAASLDRQQGRALGRGRGLERHGGHPAGAELEREVALVGSDVHRRPHVQLTHQRRDRGPA